MGLDMVAGSEEEKCGLKYVSSYVIGADYES